MNSSLRTSKDGYAVRAILPRPEGRGLPRNQINYLYALDLRVDCGDLNKAKIRRTAEQQLAAC